jgi:pSer/pThr/pTyr-binding forkhead associated (FHA) protein
MGASVGVSPDQGYMGMSEPAQPADTTASAGMMDSGAGALDQDDTVPPAIQPIPSASTNSGPMPSATSVGTGARLILISSGAEMALPDQEEITVGREDPSSGIFPDVDLTPHGGEDGGVSRRHARLLHVGDDYFVEDLQSTNFTKLDGQRLPAHVRERLDDGARLDFGRVAMIFRRG